MEEPEDATPGGGAMPSLVVVSAPAAATTAESSLVERFQALEGKVPRWRQRRTGRRWMLNMQRQGTPGVYERPEDFGSVSMWQLDCSEAPTCCKGHRICDKHRLGSRRGRTLEGSPLCCESAWTMWTNLASS